MKASQLLKSLVQKNKYTCFQAEQSALFKKMKDKIPDRVSELRRIKKDHGDKIIGTYTLNQVFGGMRGIQGLFQDISTVDPNGGVFIRGLSINQLKNDLTKAIKDGEPLPEAVFWLLNTGDVPYRKQTELVIDEWKQRGNLEDDVIKFILSLPKTLSSSNMLSQCVLYLQRDSLFKQAYAEGKANKANNWMYYHEDSMNLIAKLPRVAAIIYRHKYHNGDIIAPNPELDWAGNYAHMMGFNTEVMREYMRGFMSIHSDHEGGSIAAHTSHLVGSALGDPYLCLSAAINSVGGNKYGLANHEVLKWVLQLKQKHGSAQNITENHILEFVKEWFKTKKGLAGYGHVTLKETDPRYFHQKAFGQKYLAHDPLVQLCQRCTEVIPEYLSEERKEFRNPHPNVDAYSGILLYALGLTQYEYYNTVFALSRSLGNLSWITWARAYGLPIERPNSFDYAWLEKKFAE